MQSKSPHARAVVFPAYMLDVNGATPENRAERDRILDAALTSCDSEIAKEILTSASLHADMLDKGHIRGCPFGSVAEWESSAPCAVCSAIPLNGLCQCGDEEQRTAKLADARQRLAANYTIRTAQGKDIMEHLCAAVAAARKFGHSDITACCEMTECDVAMWLQEVADREPVEEPADNAS